MFAAGEGMPPHADVGVTPTYFFCLKYRKMISIYYASAGFYEPWVEHFN